MDSPTEATSALLTRAKTYPYRVPASSYAFASGDAIPLIRADLEFPLESEVSDGRIRSTLRDWAARRGINTSDEDEPVEPLLAYGCNASLEGLSRKFAEHPESPLLPVAKATLQDFDVVYSAHISSYGAIPGALQYSPGARAPVCLLLSTARQCRMLRRTEPNYVLAMLHGIDLQLAQGQSLPSVRVVLSRHGLLSVAGSEVAVAASATANRRFPAMTEEAILRAVRDVVAPGMDVDDFIAQNVRNPAVALHRTETLRRQAHHFTYPSWQQLDD